MITRYRYLGETTIEVVIDGDCVEVNLLPPEPIFTPAVNMADSVNMEPPEPRQELPQLPLSVAPYTPPPLMGAAVSAPAKKSVGKNVAAAIRGMWTFLIAVFVEGGTYMLNSWTSLDIPQGYAILGGALLQGAVYATKKRAFPDSVL